jgi:hypothetical protein
LLNFGPYLEYSGFERSVVMPLPKTFDEAVVEMVREGNMDAKLAFATAKRNCSELYRKAVDETLTVLADRIMFERFRGIRK